MPTDGIRFTEFIWMIKSFEWEINSLNEAPIQFGVTIVFKSIRFVVLKVLEGEKKTAMAGCCNVRLVREEEEGDARSGHWLASV